MEKRRHQRLHLDLEAVCQADGSFFKAYVQDISAGGLKLEAQKRIEKGRSVAMSIDSKPPLKLSGGVMWRTKKHLHFIYGIKFDQPSKEKEAALRELVQSLFWKNYGG